MIPPGAMIQPTIVVRPQVGWQVKTPRWHIGDQPPMPVSSLPKLDLRVKPQILYLILNSFQLSQSEVLLYRLNAIWVPTELASGCRSFLVPSLIDVITEAILRLIWLLHWQKRIRVHMLEVH